MFDDPPDIYIGPPGCGKTTRLVSVLREELARGVDPRRIGFVTFTRKAAQEALDRVTEEFKLSRADVPHFRTLHSLCMRYCGLNPDSIFQGEKVDAFAKWINEPIHGRVSVDGTWSGYARGDRLMFMVNLARIRRMGLRDLYLADPDDLDWNVLERFHRGLEEYKRELNLFDYTDMIQRFVELGNRPPLEVLLVDEAQDLSDIQWEAVFLLARGTRRCVVAGDDDQSIFEWAGANTGMLIDLPGHASVLDQSYRVPRAVQNVANMVIGRVKHRREKLWHPREEEGLVRKVASVDHAGFDGDDVLILTRNRHQLDPIETALRSKGVMYSKEGLPAVKQSLLTAIVTWERLRRDEPQRAKDVVDGPYKLMTTGLGVGRGHKTLPKFGPDDLVGIRDLQQEGGLRTTAVWHEALDKLPSETRFYIMRCRRNGEKLSTAPRIRLSTIHGAKGGEADRVVLLTDMAPRTWREYHNNPDAEHRVFYVGITRAKRELTIVHPTTPRNFVL